MDNELHFTNNFLYAQDQKKRDADTIRSIIATIMAYGCNIGPYAMARLIDGVQYKTIKKIINWQVTEDKQKSALADIVNAIANIETTKYWGDGTKSSSDGKKYRSGRKILQRTYSPKFKDFAVEFYTFVADNYAPFYSIPIQCSERDASYVLDGLLYNENDLQLEEHFTDTHGYTEITFTAFCMLGRRFQPRIKDIASQRIYRIDKNKVYKSLTGLLNRYPSTIKLDRICEEWDNMGRFYASLESGHTTASLGLKRLVSLSGKNSFHKANRELGRILKTEFILDYMSNRALRKKIHVGVLKGESLHALASDVFYGNRGQVNAQTLQAQINSCSCLTLSLACIIYWQAKEIDRVITGNKPDKDKVDISMLQHISPIGWENIILYGEYVIDKKLIR